MSSVKQCFISLLLLSLYFKCEGIILNKDVERTIDLRSHLVKISYRITPEFDLNGVENHYIFLIPLPECENLSFLSAKDSLRNEITFIWKKSSDYCEYFLNLNNTMPTTVIDIDTVFTKLLTPHPKEILQAEKQLVKFHGNAYFFSPYLTLTQKTTFQLSSQNILSYTTIKPVSVSSNVIKCGPYEKIKEFSTLPMEVHFENLSPFLSVTHLERSIEVSHWGNIAVEEKIYIAHSGAKLKGQFSRYDLQKDGRSGQSAIKSYKTLLPASASGVYYRDSNGNISTSNMKVQLDAVELELRPRFALFGGWKTNYILGYNVPSFEYLFNQNDHYILKMRVIDHIYDDMSIDETVVNIILPEGSTNIELKTPYSVNRIVDNIYHTYLDTLGRPVVSFSKYNLVENHIQDFYLKYNFLQVSMLQEPLLLVAFIFSMFLVVIVFIRLDFSISRKENQCHRD